MCRCIGTALRALEMMYAIQEQRWSLSVVWFAADIGKKETIHWLFSYVSLKFRVALQIWQLVSILSNLCSIALISCHQFGQVKKDPNSINKH